MIDGLKLSKYLNDTELHIQEFWFLYAMMNLERNENILPFTDENKNFNEYIKTYFTKISPDVGNIDYNWSDVGFNLEKREWLEINQKKESPLVLKNCRVTDKFKSTFFISDIEQAIKELIEIYPKQLYHNGKKQPYPAIDKSPEELAEYYNSKVLKNGNAFEHQRCLLITEIWVADNNNEIPYKISTYLDRFHGIALMYEGQSKKNKKKTNTGRTLGN
jgi:hypothetical protein